MKTRNPRTKLIALVIAMIAVIIRIASAAGEGQQASQFEHWLPDGTKIVFTKDGNCFALVEKVTFTTTRDNPNFVPIQNAGEIYMMNPDGSDPERVTDNLVQDTFSQFSPDGKKFIFDSNRLRLETDPINVVDLFVMATDGSEQTHVTRGNSAQWAPDSKNIVYHRSASGTGLPIRLDPGAPDTDSDIFRVNVDDCCGMGVNPINLTNSPTLIEDDPHWSPDGTKIVYTASPVILHAHIEDSTNNPANRGSVVFQYCSLKGRPPNDIDRVDEAPRAAPRLRRPLSAMLRLSAVRLSSRRRT
jgi:Tol biopolymer transport system component